MMTRRSCKAAAAAGLLTAASGGTNGYAPVTGLQLCYEIYGDGDPLILLRLGVGAIKMFHDVLPSPSKSQRVLAVDLQGDLQRHSARGVDEAGPIGPSCRDEHTTTFFYSPALAAAVTPVLDPHGKGDR